MKKPKILSVDDEASFTELLKQYFEPRGYDIDVTSAGYEALKLLRSKKYDVVLLDFRMSGLNGEEVMAEIKKRDPGIRIIFITAYSDSGRTMERLLNEGAYAYMEKPITSLKHLEQLVNNEIDPDR